jgi:flagellar export protein FliJ
MSDGKDTIRSLGTLVRLRSTEVERLEADMARQEATRQRHQTVLARLTALAEGSGPSGAPKAGRRLSPALAVNVGAYKENVFALADTQRTDLHLHEANMAVSQRNLAQAWTRRELLGKVLEQKVAAHADAQERVQRKREDDVATQSWLAGRSE